MLASTKAIVLRNTKYSDNKNIVTLLTEDYGKMSYMVYSPHSKRANLRSNLLQVLSILELQVEHREGRALQQIKEASPYMLNTQVLNDPIKAAFSFFIAEVIDKSIFAPEKDKQIFNFLTDYIIQLQQSDKVEALAPVDFIMTFSSHLGFYPYDGAENEYLQQFSSDKRLTPFLEYLQGKHDFDRAKRRDILHLAVDYLRLNLPGLRSIASVSVLESFFS